MAANETDDKTGKGIIWIEAFRRWLLIETDNAADQKNRQNKMSKQLPTKWVLGWSGDIELGFDDGKYLPRKPALILYPEYFDEQGNPIKDKLPFDKPKERGGEK